MYLYMFLVCIGLYSCVSLQYFGWVCEGKFNNQTNEVIIFVDFILSYYEHKYIVFTIVHDSMQCTVIECLEIC